MCCLAERCRTLLERRSWSRYLGALSATLLLLFGAGAAQAQAQAVVDWPEYQFDTGASGFTSESLITPQNASSLAAVPGFPIQGAGTISTQPVVVGGLVYWGDWSGVEHATPLPGSSATGWSTDLGQNTASGCNPPTVGVASTPDIANVKIAGHSSAQSVLFIGGGGTDTAGGGHASLYALDALTGAVLWRTNLGKAPNHFIWNSPVLYTYTSSTGASVTSVYVGVSSFGDCPLVQGQLVQLNAANGAIQHIFDVVPFGCIGGSVWTSPTVDPSTGTIYISTGNGGGICKEPYAPALVALNATNLSVIGSWQVPKSQQVVDSDFSAGPTLFSGTVTPGGIAQQLVGAANKNGLFYVFNRADISAGPVASLRTAIGGSCPQCNQGGISPAAWDGTTLYVGGGETFIGLHFYKGSVRAWNPNNLTTPLWQTGFSDGAVLGAVVGAPGLVAVGEGPYTKVLNASTGAVLTSLPVASISASSPAIFYGAPSIAHGMLFEGDTDGELYAYAPSSVSTGVAANTTSASALSPSSSG